MSQPLAKALPDLALEALNIQRQLDEGWAHQVRRLRDDFEQAGLSRFAFGQDLEASLRPTRPFVNTWGVTLQSEVVRDSTRHGGLEFRPLNAGYRAAFGITQQAHCQIELEIRQSPVAPPPSFNPNSLPT